LLSKRKCKLAFLLPDKERNADRIKIRYKNLFLIPLIGLLLIVNFSCDRKEGYVGIYVAQGEDVSKTSEIELKENGEGVWRVFDDETSFGWSVSKSEIRLHTKSGGVIIGKIKGTIIEIALPGRSVMYFKKTG
jgi:hypothetical protein